MSHDASGASCRRRCSSAFCALSVLIALVPLAFVLFFVVSQGIQVAQSRVLHAACRKPVGEPGGGMANAIVGTLIADRPRIADGDADRHHERRLHVRIRRHPLRRARSGSRRTR